MSDESSRVGWVRSGRMYRLGWSRTENKTNLAMLGFGLELSLAIIGILTGPSQTVSYCSFYLLIHFLPREPLSSPDLNQHYQLKIYWVLIPINNYRVKKNFIYYFFSQISKVNSKDSAWKSFYASIFWRKLWKWVDVFCHRWHSHRLSLNNLASL